MCGQSWSSDWNVHGASWYLIHLHNLNCGLIIDWCELSWPDFHFFEEPFRVTSEIDEHSGNLLQFKWIRVNLSSIIGQFQGQFQVSFDTISVHFWIHFRSILRPILDQFWVIFWYILSPVWVNFWSIFGTFWVNLWLIFG